MVTAILQCIGASVREMHHLDVEAVLSIERSAFPNPMPPCNLVKLVRAYSNRTLVLERGVGLKAYCAFENRKHSIAIRRIACSQKLCGFGRTIIAEIQRRCLQDGKNRIEALVDETDVASQLFFSKVGFTAVDIIRAPGGDQYLFRHLRGQR